MIGVDLSCQGFNAAFEELYSTQKQFSVPDSDLRSQLRNINVEQVVPKYLAFLEKSYSLVIMIFPPPIKFII